MTDDELLDILLSALARAYKVHEELGDLGTEPVETNRFGETALRGDIEIEKAVLETLEKAGMPIRVVSEEHGITDRAAQPRLLGFLDGLDGSDVYRKGRGRARYGTLLGIFSGLEPLYGDFRVCGIMEHSTNKLFYAVKRRGSFVVQDGEKRRISCAGTSALTAQTRICIDAYWDVNRETFSRRLKAFRHRDLGSSAAAYASLVSDETDLVLECTRKGNLELAVAYGLVVEAGGAMVTLQREDLGGKNVLAFGQRVHLPIVSACTMELARELIRAVEQER